MLNRLALGRRFAGMVAICLALGPVAACGDDGGGGEEDEFATLDPELLWYGDNRASLEGLIVDLGTPLGATPQGDLPVAVFDFDNTVIKGDIGDGIIFHMFANDLVRRPLTWAETSQHLTAEALASLDTHCPLDSIADPLPTSTDLDCLTAILCIYVESAVWNETQAEGDPGELCTGAAAFALTGGATEDTIEPAFAWSISLQAGYTAQEIADFAVAAFDDRLALSIGETRALGYLADVDAYIRVNEHIRDLIDKLRQSGFDVWVSSATTEFVVDPVATRELGVPADHVIGARPAVDGGGLQTYGFAACGPFGDDNQEIMNFRQGKRCFLNAIAFGVSDPDLQMSEPSPIVFGAGDSDTDVFFLKDAAALRLALNRNKTELMCNAYANADGAWLINPLFIEPKGQRAGGYDCSSFGLPDAEDTVFCDNATYDAASCSDQLQ